MKITLLQLMADHARRLSLEVVGTIAPTCTIERRHGQYSSELVGHFNLMHPQRVQVIGKEEWALLHEEGYDQQLLAMIRQKPPAIILSDGQNAEDSLIHLCAQNGVPLMRSSVIASGVIDILRTYLSRRLADTATISGVMLDVLGLGVLITGESGLGKSELALELITRGHGFVADDVTEIAQVSPYSLEGRCPEMLRDFLEVRGLGFLNIRLIFGETAVRRKMKLRLIVNLVRLSDYQEFSRVPNEEEEMILGVKIRRVNLPVSAGRNLAVMVEAAVRNTILKLRGFNPSAELLRRHAQMLYQQREPMPEPDPSANQ